MPSSISNLVSCGGRFGALLEEVSRLRERIVSDTASEIAALDLEHAGTDNLASISNLLNYVVMRREDLRSLQARLAAAGLSSLGRGEPHVLQNIDRVIDMLSCAAVNRPTCAGNAADPPDFDAGHRVLRARAARMFGSPPAGRAVYIMVTMPTEAAAEPALVEALLDTGMDTARINCAHDDEKIWARIIDNIRDASRRLNKECRILMDLAGHKIRTKNVITRDGTDNIPRRKPRRVRKDDWIVLAKESAPLHVYGKSFDVPVRALVTCTCSQVVDRLNVDDTAWIDDGKIGAQVKAKSALAALLQVTQVGPKGARIKKEKGLNFPETRLELPALSKKDLADLAFVSRHADMVGLSFTERPEDVLQLHEQLEAHGAGNLPLIAKIETAHAVRRLPDILAETLARNIELGILLARGDLAVELGSVRMAEIQEEILWLCEAAHTPVIWATQVLETLAKDGVVSRPEITDAAMSVRAECVMLNKGPYIRHAVSILGNVLQRMEAHQFKKVSRLRALHW